MFGLGLAEVLPLEVEVLVGVHSNVIHTLHQLTEVLFQNSTEQRMIYVTRSNTSEIHFLFLRKGANSDGLGRHINTLLNSLA